MLSSTVRVASRAPGLLASALAAAAPARSSLSLLSAAPARAASFETKKRTVKAVKHVVTSVPEPVAPVKVAAAADADAGAQVHYSHPMAAFHDPARPAFSIANSELFAVIDINSKQFKVAAGDLVMANHIKGVSVGDQLSLDQVLLVGSRDFTVIGTPRVADASVLVTVEEQTHLQPRNVFHFRRRTGFHDMKRFADLITVLRVDSVSLPSAPAPRAAAEIAPAVKLHDKEHCVPVKFGGRKRPTVLLAKAPAAEAAAPSA